MALSQAAGSSTAAVLAAAPCPRRAQGCSHPRSALHVRLGCGRPWPRAANHGQAARAHAGRDDGALRASRHGSGEGGGGSRVGGIAKSISDKTAGLRQAGNGSIDHLARTRPSGCRGGEMGDGCGEWPGIERLGLLARKRISSSSPVSFVSTMHGSSLAPYQVAAVTSFPRLSTIWLAFFLDADRGRLRSVTDPAAAHLAASRQSDRLASVFRPVSGCRRDVDQTIGRVSPWTPHPFPSS
jgi:hypothetical protein